MEFFPCHVQQLNVTQQRFEQFLPDHFLNAGIVDVRGKFFQLFAAVAGIRFK